jgi:adenylate cyclase
MLRHTPVIMLSALDEIDRVVRCIEVGADDYLPKPFNPVLLRARINACLEKKTVAGPGTGILGAVAIGTGEIRGIAVEHSAAVDRRAVEERGNDDRRQFSLNVTVLFADLVDFTRLAARISAPEVVQLLNEVFSQFDWLAELHRLEKIKTIGDAYMVVGGLPVPQPDHAVAVAEMALDMQKVVGRMEY